MDAGINLELAVQNIRSTQATQANTAKTDGNGQSGTGFQDLLEQCRKELTETAGQVSESDQQTGAEQPGNEKDTQTAEQMEALAQLVLPAVFSQSAQIPVENLQQPTTETVVAAMSAVEMPQAEVQQVGVQQAWVMTPGNEQPQAQETGESTVSEVGPTTAVVAEPVQAQEKAQAATVDTQLPEQTQQQTDDQNSGDSKLDASVVSNNWNTTLFEELDQAPVRVGDTPVDMTQSAQQVQKDLGVRLQSALENGADHMAIQLEPESLGTVVAEFTRSPEGVLHVVLHAQKEQTAQLLQEHAPALGLLLQDNTHGEVQVQVTQPQQDQTAWQQDGQNGGQQQQRQQQQHRNPNQNESESFLHQLRLGLVQQSIQPV